MLVINPLAFNMLKPAPWYFRGGLNAKELNRNPFEVKNHIFYYVGVHSTTTPLVPQLLELENGSAFPTVHLNLY